MMTVNHTVNLIKAMLLLTVCLFPPSAVAQGVIYITSNGKVSFTSDAPMEMIEASSNSLIGGIKSADKSFAFSILVKSFEGFNSSLQRTHFNENYMESDKYPKITFDGKIIEDIDLTKNGTYNIRGKGQFSIHGIKQERIIQCKLVITNGKLKVSSKFTVLLDDHNIKIPAVVNQKIAEEIAVTINIDMLIKQ